MTTGETLLQEMINIVTNYNNNAAFFNLSIPLMALQEWHLVGDAQTQLGYLENTANWHQTKLNAIYQGLGLPIPLST